MRIVRASVLLPAKMRKQNDWRCQMITKMHSDGFNEEWYLSCPDAEVFSVTDPTWFIQYFETLMVDKVYDKLTDTYKYLHLIESCDGEWGILLAGKCLLNNFPALGGISDDDQATFICVK